VAGIWDCTAATNVDAVDVKGIGGLKRACLVIVRIVSVVGGFMWMG
jgi:hypothetical protein